MRTTATMQIQTSATQPTTAPIIAGVLLEGSGLAVEEAELGVPVPVPAPVPEAGAAVVVEPDWVAVWETEAPEVVDKETAGLDELECGVLDDVKVLVLVVKAFQSAVLPGLSPQAR
jgi:hypothetical protein